VKHRQYYYYSLSSTKDDKLTFLISHLNYFFLSSTFLVFSTANYQVNMAPCNRNSICIRFSLSSLTFLAHNSNKMMLLIGYLNTLNGFHLNVLLSDRISSLFGLVKCWYRFLEFVVTHFPRLMIDEGEQLFNFIERPINVFLC